MKRNSVILIPALNPDKELIQYIQELKRNGFDDIIVVNDGSIDNTSLIIERSRWTVKCCSMRLISEKEEP